MTDEQGRSRRVTVRGVRRSRSIRRLGDVGVPQVSQALQSRGSLSGNGAGNGSASFAAAERVAADDIDQERSVQVPALWDARE